MIGVNLEPVDLEENIHDRLTISEGRIATVENVKKISSTRGRYGTFDGKSKNRCY